MPEILGELEWSMSTDAEGHRTYNLKTLIEADSADQGPGTISETPGLATPGTVWSIGTDFDPWAFMSAEQEINPVITNEPNLFWIIDQKFTTKREGGQKCQDQNIEDPLDEPPEISGSFVKYTKQVAQDRDGDPIMSSSFERIKGPQVERDFNRPTVSITVNVATLALGAYAQKQDHVSDGVMWGLPAGCVKLSTVSWQRQRYGVCNFYYTVTYEFDIDFEAFVRYILDEGNKHLAPGGDPTNPKHFIQYKDEVTKENARCLLDGAGVAIEDEADMFFHEKYLYGETDLFALEGVPTSL